MTLTRSPSGQFAARSGVWFMRLSMTVWWRFRWLCWVGCSATTGMLAVSTGISILILITGLYYFRRMERRFADMV